ELDLVGPAWDVQKELMTMPSKSQDDTPWAAERQAVRHFKKTMLLVAGAAVKYQMDGRHNLEEQQEVVMHIADIAIDGFIAESQLLRAMRLANGPSPYPAAVVDAITRLCIHDAQHRIQQHATEALMAFATGDELLIMLKGVKRFSAYAPINTVAARRAIADHLIAADAYALEP